MKQPFEFDPIKLAAAKRPETPGIEGSSFGKLADLAARAAEETTGSRIWGAYPAHSSHRPGSWICNDAGRGSDEAGSRRR